MTAAETLLLIVLSGLLLLLLLLWTRMQRYRNHAARASRDRVAAEVARAESEDALRIAHKQIDALGEASLDALLLLDSNRRIVWGNQVMWRLFEENRPAVGHSFISLVHDFELNQAIADALRGNRPIVRQATLGERTLRIHAVPLTETGGVAVAIEDVTELQRLGRARRDFVANISHELRNPLANIDLAAQTLRSARDKDGDLRQRMLDQIQGQVQALSQLSQEMMDLAQIESGQVLLKMVPRQLEPLIGQAIELLLPQAALKYQEICVDVPVDLAALMDEQQVIRVIRNLVHNAVKFSPPGGKIHIVAETAGEDDVRVCVEDNGPGIPETEQARVFERFYKQDRARSKGGTGLGLAIARHIVEGHGGRIWMESTPGQGARFFFTLPRA